jgi:hypothetical protein
MTPRSPKIANDTSGAWSQPVRFARWRDLLAEGLVGRVDEALQLAATPPRDRLDADVERRRDATQRRERQPIQVAALHQRDQ